MGWLTAFITANLIGIGSNFDNCGTGIAYGSAQIKFPREVMAIVNIVGFCTALFGAYGGQIISHYISAPQAKWIASIVLVCIGVFFWYSSYVHPKISKQKTKIQIKKPGWKEGILLGLALSFTNIASGFGATVANAATLWATVISITVWGYIMMLLGNVIGIGVIAKLLGKYASLVSGLMLILVGLHQL